MNKFRKSILSLAVLAVLTLGVFALDSDYKNNLLKVDLVKTGNDSYQVNLFTQKPYTNSVKVIKKSDTSYYILLPETYHSITSVSASDDVKNVDVKLNPYAGQDLNNGYTKITINTFKPLNFSTSVRTSGGSAPKVDFDKLAKLDSVFSQSQKQAVAEPVKVAEPPKVAEPVKVAQVPQKPAVEPKKPAVESPIQVSVPRASVVAPSPKQTVESQGAKIAQNVQPVKPLVKAAETVKAQTAPVKTVVIDVEQDDKAPVVAKKQPVLPKVVVTAEAPVVEIKEEDVTPLEVLAPQTTESVALDNEADVQDISKLEEEQPVVAQNTGKRAALKTLLRVCYNKVLDNLALVAGVFVALLLLSLFVVAAKRKKKPVVQDDLVGLQAQADIMFQEPQVTFASEHPEESVAPYVEEAPQTVEMYTIPAPSEDEVPMYEPPAAPVAQEVQTPTYTAPVEPVYAAPTAPVAETPSDEAQVLSHTQIAPDRGFYLARFEGQVSLLGYINEDLFVIHTFDVEPSETHIAYRLSEKSSEGNFYLVKVGNAKMLVRSSLQALSLELLM